MTYRVRPTAGVVINSHDVDDVSRLVNAVDHSVGAAACGVIAMLLAGEGLAHPMRVVR
jgi:hypothetical protein